jgi:hypothetical protein
MWYFGVMRSITARKPPGKLPSFAEGGRRAVGCPSADQIAPGGALTGRRQAGPAEDFVVIGVMYEESAYMYYMLENSSYIAGTASKTVCRDITIVPCDVPGYGVR